MDANIRITRIDIIDTVYPPELLVLYEAWSPLYSMSAVINFQCKVPLLSLTWTYTKSIKFDSSSSSHSSVHLKIEPDILRLIMDRLPENEKEIDLNIHVGLFHRFMEQSLSSDSKVIKLTRIELNELGNRNQKPKGQGLDPAITGAYRLASRRSIDSIQGFDAKILGSFIEYFKKNLVEDEEFKNMAKLKEVVDLVDGSYLDIRWALGALLYSFHEAMLKKFFKVHFLGTDLSNKSYDEVLRALKKVFDEYNIAYNERDFSLLKGERDYRHKIIHEGHIPDDSDLQEIFKTTARMMLWISELKALHLSKAKDFQ